MTIIGPLCTNFLSLYYIMSGKGNLNVGLGAYALTLNTESNNTAVGAYSLTAHIKGVNNTAIGYNSGLRDVSGSYNTFLGASADISRILLYDFLISFFFILKIIFSPLAYIV